MQKNRFIKILLRPEIYLFILLLSLSVLYLFIAPPTTAPDETAHLAYPRHVLVENELPIFQTPEDTWESHQPPLYYIASLPFISVFSQNSVETQLTLNRLVSILFFLGTFIALFCATKNFFPENKSLQILFLTPLALPMVLYTAGSFNNDISMLLGSSILLLLASKKTTLQSDKHAIIIGFIFGLILLTKFHIYPILLIFGLYIFWKKTIRFWIISSLTAVITSGWWFMRNYSEIGDITGLKNTFILWENQQVKEFSLAIISSFITKTFSSFIGVFGKLNITFPDIVYVISGILFIILLLLVLKQKKNNLTRVIVLAVVATLVLMLIQSFKFFQPQGRYLISLIPFLGYLLAASFKLHFVKMQKAITITIIFLLTALNIYGLILIDAHYKSKPIQFFENNREINILNYSFIGKKDYTPSVHSNLDINKSESFYTLADLRFPTDKPVILSITASNPQNTSLRVYWKVLGMHSFTRERSLLLQMEEENSIIIPEIDKNLLQDIKFQFIDVSTPISISSITLTH